MKTFNPNSTFIYIVAGIVILFVLAQSIFFLIKSIRRAKQINMNMKTVAKTIGSTTVFTLAPAFSWELLLYLDFWDFHFLGFVLA